MSAYNEYFLNYLKNDRTGRAVMLTAPWGAGKSFYIRNKLKPFLESRNFHCVIVSLYGLHSISDISKSIYLEIRAGNLAKKSEGKAIAGIIGKTIVKGIAGYFGVPLEISDEDLKMLYSSINLKSKLIILEDLERSELAPVSVLGFVNGLVEDDGAKVLLVANESEIAGGEKGAFMSEEWSSNAKYRLVKEKTIGDTIHFQLDPRKSISEVLSSYGRFLLKDKVDRESLVEQILSVMSELKDYYARYVAKSIVKAGLADKCEVGVSYSIGVSNPISVSIDTFGTGIIGDDELLKLVDDHFDFSVGNIIKELKLKDISYQRLAEYGHFGNDIYPWEHVDGKAEELKKATAKASA